MNPVFSHVTLNHDLDHDDFLPCWLELIHHPVFREMHPHFSEERRLLRLKGELETIMVDGCNALRVTLRNMCQRSVQVNFRPNF